MFKFCSPTVAKISGSAARDNQIPVSFLFPLNYIDNFLPNISNSVITTHPLIWCQTLHESFFSKFDNCPADC